MRYVTVNSAEFWAESFIKQMIKMMAFSQHVIPDLDFGDIAFQYNSSKKRIILLGYDGKSASYFPNRLVFNDPNIRNPLSDSAAARSGYPE